MPKNDSDEEEETKTESKPQIQTEVNLLPPLLPLKFGNGLLLQYTVNYPGVDDKLLLLEVGLITGTTSLALVLLATMVKYLLKTAATVWQLKTERVKHLTGLVKQLNNLVGVLQVLLLVVLFIYSVSSRLTMSRKESTRLLLSCPSSCSSLPWWQAPS